MNTTCITQPAPAGRETVSSLHSAVDRFLAAAQEGNPTADLSTTDATVHVTVPGWRFHRRTAAVVSAECPGWLSSHRTFEELERMRLGDGEIVPYVVASEDDGVPFAAHHCHRAVVDPAAARIASDCVFCGGRWNAELLAAMAEAGR